MAKVFYAIIYPITTHSIVARPPCADAHDLRYPQDFFARFCARLFEKEAFRAEVTVGIASVKVFQGHAHLPKTHGRHS